MDEEEARKPTPIHEVGMSLDAISVDELAEKIDLLRAEIKRLELEIEKKSASRSAAESAFK